jgi:anhydro-N-acetylmuramic acid kinase
MDSQNNYKVIGIMSGTSLDGLDIAYCQFKSTLKGWKASIIHAETISYSSRWLKELAAVHTLSGEALIALDVAYGDYIGQKANEFIQRNQLRGIHFIASHGHTIFHQPARKFTFQLGNGNAIHAATGLPVVYDFRMLDVTLGGQGAPLVPVGDKFLFSDYDVCLNLGGIANLSLDVQRQRRAYDVCFANMGLNYLANKKGKSFDASGAMASEGEMNNAMMKSLTKIYSTIHVKRPSLGREMFETKIKPLLDDESISLPDRLRTFTESIAEQIVGDLLSYKRKMNVLCTGGGAYNSFLISRMLNYAGDDIQFILPEDDVIKFKEAMVFAFLGILRVRGKVNVLKSVTGASRDNSGGLRIGF